MGQGRRFSPRNPRQVRGDCILGYGTYYGMQNEKNSGIGQRILCEGQYGMFRWQTKGRETEESRWIGVEQAWGSGGEGDRKGQSRMRRLLGSMLAWALHLITAGYPIFLPNSVCNHVVSALSPPHLCANTSKLPVGRPEELCSCRDQHLEANPCKGGVSKTSYWRHPYCAHARV